MKKYKAPLSHILNPGHSACAGCGMIIAARLVTDTAGPNTILTNATGCSEVTTTQYPMTAFKVPWIHSLFENSSCLASGIYYALKHEGKDREVNVIALGGDGATFDIGLGHISGLWERGDNVLYVCYDNEAYENTGYQTSGSTPLDANTTTAPAGKKSFGNPTRKKDMVAIALAHHVPYVATATVGYPADLVAKVKKALSVKGPKYLQLYVPCVPGWGIDPKDTINVAKLAVQTGYYPIVEYVNGELTNKMKVTQKKPVEEFLKLQKRFKHLFKPGAEAELKKLQDICEENIKRFELM
ncbi:MAG: thiamine pyrophosphate-dependent enzyme [Patescibacteria group bacterium]|jgi:pyruvate ferredoxin oxidoreductase beta subunit